MFQPIRVEHTVRPSSWLYPGAWRQFASILKLGVEFLRHTVEHAADDVVALTLAAVDHLVEAGAVGEQVRQVLNEIAFAVLHQCHGVVDLKLLEIMREYSI